MVKGKEKWERGAGVEVSGEMCRRRCAVYKRGDEGRERSREKGRCRERRGHGDRERKSER